MGDRCYIQLICKPEHVQDFERDGFYLNNDPVADGYAEMVDEEGYYRPDEWPKVMYSGWHGNGYEYTAHAFFRDDRGPAQCWPKGENGEGYCLSVNDGEYGPSNAQLRRLRTFLIGMEKVDRRLGLVLDKRPVPSKAKT